MSTGGLPEEVATEVARALSVSPSELVVEGRVGGGCIHPAVRLSAESAPPAFLKWSRDPGPAGFGIEAEGLRALRARGGVAVPRVLGASDGEGTQHGWLLLEWIEPGAPDGDTATKLGRGLAHLHRALEEAEPGWARDGWIATLRQPNPPGLDWPGFWARARLEPQWRLAREAGRIGTRGTGPVGTREDEAMDRLLASVEEALDGWDVDGIALLHGDLWSGNVLVAADGSPHLVDPAAYRGHREVDLAMMDLFGGFEPGTRAAYEEAAPLAPGYREVRRSVYQLYPLLVHVNLFGGGYVGRTLATLREVLAELG